MLKIGKYYIEKENDKLSGQPCVFCTAYLDPDKEKEVTMFTIKGTRGMSEKNINLKIMQEVKLRLR